MADIAETAVGEVTSTVVVGSAHGLDMSLWGMFMQADLVVKSVIILLLIASFWCWGIIFEKWLSFRNARARAARFEKEFWSASELDGFYEKTRKRKIRHPYAEVFLAAMEEWYRSQKATRGQETLSQRLNLRDRMFQIMGVTRNREVDRLANGIGFLATVGSSAPFIGLFGTVWGIMNSFQSIALSENTSLAVVAPGIAEALFATAIGLFAAIPSVIAYNKFAGELDKYDGRLEDFSVEFHTLLSRQIEG